MCRRNDDWVSISSITVGGRGLVTLDDFSAPFRLLSTIKSSEKVSEKINFKLTSI